MGQKEQTSNPCKAGPTLPQDPALFLSRALVQTKNMSMRPVMKHNIRYIQ